MSGLPSCHVTPGLSVQTTERPSAASAPFSLDGIEAASTGTRLPSASQAASGS